MNELSTVFLVMIAYAAAMLFITLAYLYEHVWDADETVPQERARKLSDLQRKIEEMMS